MFLGKTKDKSFKKIWAKMNFLQWIFHFLAPTVPNFMQKIRKTDEAILKKNSQLREERTNQHRRNYRIYPVKTIGPKN